MPATLSTNSPVLRMLAGAALLAALAGCQHYAPNSRPERDSTEAITRAQVERLQERGASRAMAPSQIRIATGGLTQPDDAAECRDWLSPCWEAGAGSAPAAGTPGLLRAPRPADAQTFRGVLPCQEAAMGCQAQHATLTLFVNGSWRARVSPLDAAGRAGAPIEQQGCWSRLGEPRQLALTLANGNPLAEFTADSVNTLVVRDPDENPGALRYTLTRQPGPELLGGAPQNLRCPV